MTTETGEATGNLADQLLRLTRRLHRTQKEHLRPLGITPAMARLLRTAAHSPEPLRMVDLAQRLDVVPRAVTSLVDGLEAYGMVRRVPDPANRRVVRVELTDDGRAALEQLRAARRAAAEELLAPLGPEQRRQLGDLLTALVADPGSGRANCA
ncbi:MarR family winged helix-turn-helix transcriptional regulator [Streptantibioticus rubrisoli]|uniref:MarR family transcriptional regulator n=1 Tax=Streptantibioticus rubrisoli TaxID=1387313 RepID=A0ABT1P8V8_9ACTN|nr:MarR family transcriptional regulator [Streptantibioticus rubrisoli]MCQ4041796.1 MarR family transcriptional regulator [Streptantibioticus rubrisoli]